MLRSQILLYPLNFLTHALPAQAKNDGSFYMEWPDFASWFGECRIVDPRCFDRLSEDSLARVDGVAGSWVAGRSAGGGADKHPQTFAYNPTFELTGADTEVLTVLSPSEIELLPI